MSKFKVGDKVVLRPETKPYTLTDNGKIVEKLETLIDGFEYTVAEISKQDGDIYVDHNGFSAIRHHHLKHAEPITKVKGEFNNFQPRDLQELEIPSNDIATTELRLAIFNGNPSRTLEEMQDIEKWLLNK